jgi:hypothetical protein
LSYPGISGHFGKVKLVFAYRLPTGRLGVKYPRNGVKRYVE